MVLEQTLPLHSNKSYFSYHHVDGVGQQGQAKTLTFMVLGTVMGMKPAALFLLVLSLSLVMSPEVVSTVAIT